MVTCWTALRAAQYGFVQLALAFQGLAIDLVAVEVWLEGLAGRRFCGFDLGSSQRLKRDQGGATARGFFDTGELDWFAQGVGHYLRPRRRIDEAAATCDDLLFAWGGGLEYLRDNGEPVGYSLHRCA